MENIAQWIEYWPFAIIVIASIFVIGYFIYTFLKKPTAKQIEQVKQWLLYAVAEAEKLLGAGTGQIKLRYVYDKFLTKFPFLVTLISFEAFSDLVDEVLIRFKDLLENSTQIKQYVEKDD